MLPKIVFTPAIRGGIDRLQKKYFSKKFFPTELNGKVGIIGVPFGKGQKKKGKHEAGLKAAPDIIRKTGFVKSLEGLGLEVCDYGNLEYEPEQCDAFLNNMHNLDHFSGCSKALSLTVQAILGEGKKCLVLGGDHSIAVGSIYGHMNVAGPKQVALVYVDAHPDINTSSTSLSGNIHGMTVALLAQELHSSWPESGIPGMNWMTPSFPLKNMAFIGIRSVDPGEAKFLCDNQAIVYSMDEVEKYGIFRILCKALTSIDPTSCKSLHLSFDIDALDFFEAPCTTVPVRGGLTLREALEIIEFLHSTGRLSVIDLVEVNPALGNEIQKEATLDAVKHLLLGMFGHSRRGNIQE